MCQRAPANITSRQMIYAWQHNSSFGADSPAPPHPLQQEKSHKGHKAHKTINDHGQLARAVRSSELGF